MITRCFGHVHNHLRLKTITFSFFHAVETPITRYYKMLLKPLAYHVFHPLSAKTPLRSLPGHAKAHATGRGASGRHGDHPGEPVGTDFSPFTIASSVCLPQKERWPRFFPTESGLVRSKAPRLGKSASPRGNPTKGIKMASPKLEAATSFSKSMKSQDIWSWNLKKISNPNPKCSFWTKMVPFYRFFEIWPVASEQSQQLSPFFLGNLDSRTNLPEFKFLHHILKM